MQELAREGVEDEVHATAFRFSHDTIHKRPVARVEDLVSRDVVVLHQVLDLFFAANCDIHIGLQHLGNLNRRQAHSPTRAVYEDGLWRDHGSVNALPPYAITSGLLATYLAFCDASNVDHGVNRGEIRYKHRSSLIEGEAVGNLHADSSQRGCICGKGVFPAEANHPITYLEVVGADICAHACDDACSFDSEETHRQFDNAQCDQDILDGSVSNMTLTRGK